MAIGALALQIFCSSEPRSLVQAEMAEQIMAIRCDLDIGNGVEWK